MPTRMIEGVWISSYCLHIEGFSKLLYATMQRLGIQEHLEYEGHEYEEHGTKHCKSPFTSWRVKTSLTSSKKPRVRLQQDLASPIPIKSSLQSPVTPMSDLWRAHCPYAHEILSTLGEESSSLDWPHGSPTRTRRWPRHEVHNHLLASPRWATWQASLRVEEVHPPR
jgi:hypothetical protein